MWTEINPIGAYSNGHWQLEKHPVMIFFKLVKAARKGIQQWNLSGIN
jgi:hypothetical protein